MAKVTWRCQPVQERTSYWSSPTPPVACSKQPSIVQRVPAIRTSSASVVPSGAWVKWKVSPCGLARERRTSKAHWKPGAAPR